jgi:hypothetical protein
MAIYHAHISTISRSAGHSATAAAAYRAGIALTDQRTGDRHDYTRRGGVVDTLMVAPANAPAWAHDPAQLWNAAEAAENRRNSTVAREFEVSLPHELADAQRRALVQDLAQTLVDRYGFAIQASTHAPHGGKGDDRNHHVHMLATTRRMGPEGLTEKTRELDGGPRGRDEVNAVRELIAQRINRHLAMAGLGERVDHRSLVNQTDDALTQGKLAQAILLAREPTQHEGKATTAAKGRGHVLNRAQLNNQVRQDNRDALARFLREAEAEGRFHQAPPGQRAQALRDAAPRPRQAPTGPLTPVGVEGYTRTINGRTIRVGGYVRKQRSAAKPAAAGGGVALPRGVSHAPSHGRTGGAAPIRGPSIGKSKDQKHEEQRQAESARLLARSARWHDQALADYIASLEAMGRHLAEWQRDHLRALVDPARPPDATSIGFKDWLAQRHQVATEIARMPDEKRQRLERLAQAQAKVERRQRRVDCADRDDPQPNRLRWKSREAWAQRREERAHRLKRAKHQHRQAEQAATPDAFAELDRQSSAMVAYLAALDRDYTPPLPKEPPAPASEPTPAPRTTAKPHARLGDHFERKDTPGPLRPRLRPPGVR